MKKNFGEITESSLQSWTIQCWEWDHPPAFGSIVCINNSNSTLFGVITAVQTGSSDPTRTVHAYKKTEQELKQELPHIFSFLQTTCIALPIAHKKEKKLYYQTSSVPPKLHSFVSCAQKDECEELFASESYLAPLMHNTSLDPGTRQEALLALLYQRKQLNLLDKQSLEAFIYAYNQHMHHDYPKVRLFLQRVQALTGQLN